MAQYSAVIFDMGKVVFDYDLNSMFQIFGEAVGLRTSIVKERITIDEDYKQHERGEISKEEYCNRLSSKIGGKKLSFSIFDAGMNSIFVKVYPDIDSILDELKEQVRIVALSNTNKSHFDFWNKKFNSTTSKFEKIFVSNHIGSRKPESSSYNHVLDYLGVPASEVLFLDDLAENIQGALNCGIEGILVTNPSQIRNQLKEYGLILN